MVSKLLLTHFLASLWLPESGGEETGGTLLPSSGGLMPKTIDYHDTIQIFSIASALIRISYVVTSMPVCFIFNSLVILCAFQARMALDKGAQAVIFDVSDDANAALEVSVKG